MNAAQETVWKSGKHIPELDGVRGLAIVLVCSYRLLREIPIEEWVGGFASKLLLFGDRGVDLFFVLSGFLITGILLEAKEKNGGLKNFYARRALRIFPLYFLALAIFLVILPWAIRLPAEFEKAHQQQAYLWFHLSNLRMSYLNEWCFGPLDHFWSLAIEEQFYLVWPALVFSLSSKMLWRTTIVLSLLVPCARIVYAMSVTGSVAPDVFTLFRCDELLVGGLIAMHMRTTSAQASVPKWLPVLAAAAFALGMGMLLTGSRLLTVPYLVWSLVWASFLYLVVCSPNQSILARAMRAKWLRFFGKYSYAIYVFQAPLIAINNQYASDEKWVEWVGSPMLGFILYASLNMALTIAVALLSWNLWEKHFLKYKPQTPA